MHAWQGYTGIKLLRADELPLLGDLAGVDRLKWETPSMARDYERALADLFRRLGYEAHANLFLCWSQSTSHDRVEAHQVEVDLVLGSPFKPEWFLEAKYLHTSDPDWARQAMHTARRQASQRKGVGCREWAGVRAAVLLIEGWRRHAAEIRIDEDQPFTRMAALAGGPIPVLRVARGALSLPRRVG